MHWQESSVKQLLSEVATSVRLASPNRLAFPNLTANDMVVDKERHISKTVYQGTFKGPGSGFPTDMKLTVSEVTSAETGSVHSEIAGTSSHVNELLASVLQSGRALGAQEVGELQGHLDNMLAFAGQVLSVLQA